MKWVGAHISWFLIYYNIGTKENRPKISMLKCLFEIGTLPLTHITHAHLYNIIRDARSMFALI